MGILLNPERWLAGKCTSPERRRKRCCVSPAPCHRRVCRSIRACQPVHQRVLCDVDSDPADQGRPLSDERQRRGTTSPCRITSDSADAVIARRASRWMSPKCRTPHFPIGLPYRSSAVEFRLSFSMRVAKTPTYPIMCLFLYFFKFHYVKKVKFSHTCYRALGPELIHPGMHVMMLLVVKGGQLWWVNAFSRSLPLCCYQCYCLARSAKLPTGLNCACVNFFLFLFLMIARRQIISGSAGPIFTIFAPNDRHLFVDDQSGPIFWFLKGRCHGNQLKSKNLAFFTDKSILSRCYLEMDCNIAILISNG